jgi:hypothetical protein
LTHLNAGVGSAAAPLLDAVVNTPRPLHVVTDSIDVVDSIDVETVIDVEASSSVILNFIMAPLGTLSRQYVYFAAGADWGIRLGRLVGFRREIIIALFSYMDAFVVVILCMISNIFHGFSNDRSEQRPKRT